LDSPLWRIIVLKADKTITIQSSLGLIALLSLLGRSFKEMSAGLFYFFREMAFRANRAV